MRGLTLQVVVGAIAGLLAWAIVEPFAPGLSDRGAWENWEMVFIGVVGASIGAGIGGALGAGSGGKVHILRGLGLGLVLGFVGGEVGVRVGGLIGALLTGGTSIPTNPILAIVVRTLALTPIGACIGLAVGLSTLSWKRGLYGLIGGAAGGFLGGIVFDIVGQVVGAGILIAKGVQEGQTAEVGGASRGILAVTMGIGIALCLNLVERFAKNAWLRLELGRGEGKEWPLFQDHTILGRSETATVPLFGDPGIKPVHAAIVRQGDTYTLHDSGGGVLVDGVAASQAMLHQGSTIQLGSTVLRFILSDRAAVRSGENRRATPYPLGPTPQAAPQAYPTQTPAYPQPAPVVSLQIVRLIALDGPLAGQAFPIQGPVEIGREASGIPLGFDSQASRRHARVLPAEGGGVQIEDLGSTNGTWLNGARVTNAQAPSGSVVRIGVTNFRVESS